MKYDLILAGGTVVDGTRAEPYQANVCIKDGKTTACYRVDVTDELGTLAATVTATGYHLK